MAYLFLSIAIIAEVIATSALKSADGFTKLFPSLLVIVGYSIAFYFLSLVLKTVPVGLAYAIWAGAGTALIALAGFFLFSQPLDLPGIIGIILIVAGVAIINLFSKTVSH